MIDGNKNIAGAGIDIGANQHTPDRSSDDNARAAAKELVESYADLVKQKVDYQNKLGTYPHYTLDDAYYLLTQGSHEQSERVQTSGTSDPVARAVADGEKVKNQLNQEMEAEYRKEVVEPYLEVCEKIQLFELGMKLLYGQRHFIADQLYIQRKPKKYVVDMQGVRIPRKRLEKEINAILDKFAWLLSFYSEFLNSGGKRLTEEVQSI